MTYARRFYDRLNKTRKQKSACVVRATTDMLNRYVVNGNRYFTIVGVEFAENLHGAFDIIHVHNVVAFALNSSDLLKGIRAVMDSCSVSVIEFQYLVDT